MNTRFDKKEICNGLNLEYLSFKTVKDENSYSLIYMEINLFKLFIECFTRCIFFLRLFNNGNSLISSNLNSTSKILFSITI